MCFSKSSKAFVCLALFLWILGCLGCGREPLKSPSVQEICNRVKQTVDISTLKEGDYPKLKRLYGISRAEIESFVLLRAPSNIKADEIAIIKVKDPKYIEDVKEKMLKRAEKQAASFRDYVPEEYFLIEKKIVRVRGNYILFAVSKDAKKVADVFEESI